MKNLYHGQTSINGGFWGFYEELNRTVTAGAIYKQFEETGRFEALKCHYEEGKTRRPHIFWDSDAVKWIEGISYILEKHPCAETEALVDAIVEDIEKNQRADGYFNSYFLTMAPNKIFTDRLSHELYCLGHAIEAAIAYHKATGKAKLLNITLKYIDYVYKVFVEEQSAAFVTPGHQEIELALLKLYNYMGNQKHLALARFFLNERGNNEKEKALEYPGYRLKSVPIYLQDNVPVREITAAVGHSVRACYMYTAMAMLAKIDSDEALLAACKRVYEDIANRKISITGGIGSDHLEENFSYPYDLPNSDTYNETCASIALAMFAGAMQEIEVNSKYGDLIERIYYNGMLSGLSSGGDAFFYTNPLEIDQLKYQRSTYQPPSERQAVFDVSCCPPNIMRMLATIPRYAYTVDEDCLYCNQFFSGETRFEVGGKEATLIQTTQYPCDSKIHFRYNGNPIKLYVRIPAWCVEYEGDTENGYAMFELTDGDRLTVDLPMNVHFVEANPNIQDNAGRYAVTRGPLVYCMEGIDNGRNLRDITLLEDADIRVTAEEGLSVPVLYINAERRQEQKTLYSLKNKDRIAFTARLIPYFSFSNRGTSDMLVWTMVR